MIEIGRVVVKLAGRDAGLKGVVIEILDKGFVLVDGQVRRRKCNIIHLEPLNKVLKLPKQASHEEVIKVLKSEGIEVEAKRKKESQKTTRPLKQRASSVKEEKVAEAKPKKAVKKEKAPKTDKKKE